jgi:DNA-binding transcriptional LysR family regulator
MQISVHYMQRVHVDRVDLDLTAPLIPLLEERHGLRAADHVGLSQPTMRRALQRLRLFSDSPLLNRDGCGSGAGRSE